MRRFLTLVFGVILASSVAMTSASACSWRPHLKIDRVTGAIELDDLSPIGDTPPSEQAHVVLVRGKLTRCASTPDLYESGTLTQNGVTYQIGGGGLGQGEINCSSGHADVEALFLGDNHAFHVGRARVHLIITNELTGAVVARGSRTVRIPADDTGL